MAGSGWWSRVEDGRWVTAETEYPEAWPAEQLRWTTLLSDPDQSSTTLTMGLASLERGDIHLLHHHPDRPEAFYVLEGTAIATLGEETLEARPGTAIYVPAGLGHGLRQRGRARFVALWVLGAPPYVTSPDLVWDDLPG